MLRLYIGCYLKYAGTRDLQALVHRLFLQYGDMFVLSLLSHKILFLKDSQVSSFLKDP